MAVKEVEVGMVVHNQATPLLHGKVINARPYNDTRKWVIVLWEDNLLCDELLADIDRCSCQREPWPAGIGTA